MKKIFHHENQTELSEMHFHDSVFGNFCYDHFDGTITVTCESECEEKNYTILFKNVIYFEMIGCQFWGNSCYLNWAGYSPCEDIVQKLFLLQEKNDIRFVERNPTLQPEKSKWNSGISYVPMLFEFLSGDRLVIFSEEIQIDIQEW